ncbi:MAG: DEAD/DEAH box helicase [Flavobacteriaceae bacterium]|nr:DEAD/DEAH box helicase [Bacteroidia bacterium]MBT8287468.1 DEAD/DEAH box helicase [Bacteroidia bacterium]NNF75953.1 DEAD/DEAH box helicase [Flavobacteriaceae bacterium]NNK73877.1 DEAD/DEAH box helicase [Flavobacteriaceae bacterium]
MTTFQDLGLEARSIQAIDELGFTSPTEIQQKAIPVLFQHDHDLVALAQTGTGKTAAFGFPMIEQINIDSRTTQGLILSPTRELCLQITNELKLYGKFFKGLNVTAIYGGASITDQARQIKKGSQIVVATPGRLKDMIGRRLIDISKIEYAVLDEADEMLNMGFYEDITSILSNTPEEKSTWLFSATMPKEVAVIAKKFMHQPVEITVGSKNQGAVNVSHEYYLVNARDRYLALKRLADFNPDIFSVIFCRTKRDTQKIAERLIEDGYNAGALHGDLSQNQRDLVMKAFRNKQIQMLVATDVAARGIDVEDITHVIHYQLPDEIEVYTHRSGRTGRAGKSGVSIVILSKSELRRIKGIEQKIQKTFERKDIPDSIEICEVQLMSLANKIHETDVNHEIDTYLEEIHALFEDTSKEELIKKVFTAEFDRFFTYYKKSKDLNVDSTSSLAKSYSADSTRYFISLGHKDGFDWMSLKDFLRETLQLKKDELYKVDVKSSFSFFNTDSDKAQRVFEVFNNFNFNGRLVKIEESDQPSRRRDRGRKSRPFKGKKNGSRSTKRSRDKKGRTDRATSKMRRSRRR